MAEPTQEERIREIKERSQEASLGLWYVWNPSQGSEDEEIVIHGGPTNKIICRTDHQEEMDYRNAEFIAHARQDVPFLLAALDAQKKRIAELELVVARKSALTKDLTTALNKQNLNTASLEINRLRAALVDREALGKLIYDTSNFGIWEEQPIEFQETWRKAADRIIAQLLSQPKEGGAG